ncbi:MAG: DUF1993 domain-containing protein [Burkholderiales bacterium]|nr:DUF1993 domain-containing protein [Pseudomonadota bacterium]MCC7067228.1 DUF1993 domain-containing protein [Burkholderiales bacterium]
MSISMYELSVPVFSRYLGNLMQQLDKGAAYASERRIDESVLPGLRLFPDMFPLSKQVQIACDFAKGASARLAGVEVPKFDDGERTLAELGARCARTREFLASLRAEQFVGSETRTIDITAGGQPVQFVGLAYLSGYALPNFYFHLTTAYNLLRHAGVALGKRDFIGG